MIQNGVEMTNPAEYIDGQIVKSQGARIEKDFVLPRRHALDKVQKLHTKVVIEGNKLYEGEEGNVQHFEPRGIANTRERRDQAGKNILTTERWQG